jgi:hypothetical protein
MAAGVLAMGKSLRVARFTPLSVACAESTTATSSSKGVVCSSSLFGSGIARARRRKNSAVSRGSFVGGQARLALQRLDGEARCARAVPRAGKVRRGQRRHRRERDAIDRAGRRHSSQPVHHEAITVCMSLEAPTIASTGQAWMHLAQPMQAASSMTATCGAR